MRSGLGPEAVVEQRKVVTDPAAIVPRLRPQVVLAPTTDTPVNAVAPQLDTATVIFTPVARPGATST